MAKIETYADASPIVGTDKLLGTDSANSDATKNFTIEDISDFVGAEVEGELIAEQQVYGFEGSDGITISSASYNTAGITTSATVSATDIEVINIGVGYGFRYTGATQRAFQLVLNTRAVVTVGSPTSLRCKVFKNSIAVSPIPMEAVLMFSGETEGGLSARYPIELTNNQTIDFRWSLDSGECTLNDLWVQIYAI